MDYRDMFERDIGMVLDNYEDTQETLTQLIAEADADPLALAYALQWWFDSSIAKALAQVPVNSDGYRLIAEITHNLPLSVFQGLAAGYLGDEANDAA